MKNTPIWPCAKNLFCLLSISMLMFSTANAQELTTVAHVDLERYMGHWYEIAAFPQRFQKGCNCTTAHYSLNKKGHVDIVNSCNKGSMMGKLVSKKGRAFVVEDSGNAKLKARFFWPFTGKYWIIDLADDYSYAVVSHPNRKYLWILSRESRMPQKTYQGILERLASKGLDTDKLVMTAQN